MTDITRCIVDRFLYFNFVSLVFKQLTSIWNKYIVRVLNAMKRFFEFSMNSQFFSFCKMNLFTRFKNERVGMKSFFVTILSVFTHVVAALALRSKETFKTLNSARVHYTSTKYNQLRAKHRLIFSGTAQNFHKTLSFWVRSYFIMLSSFLSWPCQKYYTK